MVLHHLAFCFGSVLDFLQLWTIHYIPFHHSPLKTASEALYRVILVEDLDFIGGCARIKGSFEGDNDLY